MKKMKSICMLLLSVSGLIGLIVFGADVSSFASSGVQLCLRVVIPSLFPFIVICTYINSVFSIFDLRMLRSLGRFCRISRGTEFILLVGLLGGYPIGAQCVAQSYKNGMLSKKEAERMLGFCNNAGPAFIFGMLSIYFPSKNTLWLLWAVQILSSLLTAHLTLGGSNAQVSGSSNNKTISITDAVHHSISAMTSICSWVILFKIIVSIIETNYTNGPNWLLLPLSGFLELINGCERLSSVKPVGLRFVLASAFLSFGGVCVHLQTISVTNGLQKRRYYIGKILQTIIALHLSTLFQLLTFPEEMRFTPSVLLLITIIIPLLLFMLIFFRKRCRFSVPFVIQ